MALTAKANQYHEGDALIDILAEQSYSLDGSAVLYKEFIKEQLRYFSVKDYVRAAAQVHEDFPTIESLSAATNSKGIIGVCKEYSPGFPVGKISAYMYFLVMLRILPMKFSDFYQVNAKTQTRLRDWYMPYLDELGINQAFKATKDVMRRSSRASEEGEWSRPRIMYALVYLVMRYQLFHISQLTEAQWMEFRVDLDKTSHAKQLTRVTFIQQALWEMGILPEPLPERISSFGAPKFMTKEYAFDRFPAVKPITDLYKEYSQPTFAYRVAAQKLDALGTFFDYLKGRFGTDFSLDRLTRGIVHDYVSEIKSRDFSDSYKESKVYGLKTFIQYVNANSYEFSQKGYAVCDGLIIVKKDTKLSRHTYLPRPLKKDVRDALMDCLDSVPDKKFHIFMGIMDATGLPPRETMHLTRDCARRIGDTKFQLLYYREKSRRFKAREISLEAYMLIQEAKKLNTQTKPLPHPDGRDEYFLFNDTGHELSDCWFAPQFSTLKKMAAKRFPELSNEILQAKPYQFRHTFATSKRDKGAGILTIKGLMGHESLNTTRRYVRESDQTKIGLLNKLERYFVCQAMPKDGLKQSSVDEIISNITDFRNDMGIGHCVVSATKNCPAVYRCIECKYLCSTKEDIPEIVRMIAFLKNNLNDLADVQGEEAEKEKQRTKKRIQLLADKIAAMKVPDEPDEQSSSDDNDYLSFV